MLGNLSQDLIGTDPKYPPVVDHSWLKPENYDNYPSDNNPVRIQPKLSEIWNPERQTPSATLIGNATVKPLGTRTADQEELRKKEAVSNALREAKKAFMAGMDVKQTAEHLKGLFNEDVLKAAAEGLKSVSEERGLLGNVYIDASAFDSYNEAEQFLKRHRNRLAQDILFDSERMNPGIVASLASKFRKNVVSSINYDDKLFRKYREHLMMANRIPENFVIDSKEALRHAFLYEMPEPDNAPIAKEEKKLDAEEVTEGLEKMAEEKRKADDETIEMLQWSSVRPVVSFVQEHLSKGKTAQDLKEMVRGKFALDDIKKASPYLSAILSPEPLTEKRVAGLVEEGRLSEFGAEQISALTKMFPPRKSEFEDPAVRHSEATPGHVYHMSSRKTSEEGFVGAAVKALRSGIEPQKVRARLITKTGHEKADQIMAAAMVEVNSTPAGAHANPKESKSVRPLIEEPRPRDRLPDPGTIQGQVRDILSTFEGGEMEVEIDPVNQVGGVDVADLSGKSGIDSQIQSM